MAYGLFKTKIILIKEQLYLTYRGERNPFPAWFKMFSHESRRRCQVDLIGRLFLKAWQLVHGNFMPRD